MIWKLTCSLQLLVRLVADDVAKEDAEENDAGRVGGDVFRNLSLVHSPASLLRHQIGQVAHLPAQRQNLDTVEPCLMDTPL